MRFRLNIYRVTGSLACGILAAQLFMVFHVRGETNSVARQKSLALPPALPAVKTPIEYFRELLAMSPAEREKLLADKTPEQKKVLLAKLKEYESMDREKREMRLKVTELRWYVAPLMKVAPADRTDWLAMIPKEKRPLVEERLQQWDELSPSQQKEFWDNEMAINYLLRVQSSTPEQQTNLLQSLSPQAREALEKKLTQWHSLPMEQRDRMVSRFQQFFDLNPKEKQKTLGTLSETERVQMGKTLETFQKFPPAQRRYCIESFRKFAQMNVNERSEFLQKAETWQSMSPADREDWRKLVQKLPQMPPLPPGLNMIQPPLPSAPRIKNPVVATNFSR